MLIYNIHSDTWEHDDIPRDHMDYVGAHVKDHTKVFYANGVFVELEPDVAKTIAAFPDFRIESVEYNRQKVFLSIPNGSMTGNRRIPQIKEFRTTTRLGLKEAKEACDDLIQLGSTYEVPEPHCHLLTEEGKKSLEDVGFCVIVKSFDSLPDNLFTL